MAIAEVANRDSLSKKKEELGGEDRKSKSHERRLQVHTEMLKKGVVPGVEQAPW